MCGICFSLFFNNEQSDIEISLKSTLHRRGPDISKVVRFGNLFFLGNVLWQQGEKICSQPFENEYIILLFNGDLFNIDHKKSLSMADTLYLGNILSSCQNDIEILTLLSELEGPYSLIFYHKSTQNLYFARDSLGRNSLIMEKTSTSFRIISTSYILENSLNVIEIPSFGLYKLNVNNLEVLNVFPWHDLTLTECKHQISILEANFTMKFLFENKSINPNWLNIQKNCEEDFDFYELCKTLSTDTEKLFTELIQNPNVRCALDKLLLLLEKSMKNRSTKTPKFCEECIKNEIHNLNPEIKTSCHHSKVAILFSGGIDCTILAILADKFINKCDSIDLLNFACENKNSNIKKWDVPDRITAQNSLLELKILCPQRTWNYVEVNVARKECNELMLHHIKHLIYPRNTVLDESLGIAFWFASRGEGILDNNIYKTPARIALLGSGADELFGGYKRHRNAFSRCNGSLSQKIQAVHMELERDWSRIPSRNLARDDRVISDTGKTPRAPYLEEMLVQYIRSLPVNQRCCYLLEDGIGDKLLLRLLGYNLGLKNSAFSKKRAIQFGSKIANKNQNADDISAYFL